MVDWIKVGMNALLAFSSTGAALVVAGAFNGEGWNVALLSCLFTGLLAFAKEYQSECSKQGNQPLILPSLLVF